MVFMTVEASMKTNHPFPSSMLLFLENVIVPWVLCFYSHFSSRNSSDVYVTLKKGILFVDGR